MRQPRLLKKERENMAKGKKTLFFCQNCGYESPKWLGQCPGCREWNSFVEETVSVATKGKTTVPSGSSVGKKNEPVMLADISIQENVAVAAVIIAGKS